MVILDVELLKNSADSFDLRMVKSLFALIAMVATLSNSAVKACSNTKWALLCHFNHIVCFLMPIKSVYNHYKEIKKYISTYRLRHIYIVQAISINKLVFNIMKYEEIYIMIESNKKVTPKADDINAEKKAEPSVKKDSSKAV
jgi:hypothetical protein